MKMILALIQPYRLDRVTRALQHIEGFPGMTVSDARGFGHEKLAAGHGAREQLKDFTETSRIETVVGEGLVDAVVAAITTAARSGGHSDGKIFVLPVDEGVRISTDARGPDVD